MGVFAWEALPVEVLDAVAPFLLGFDLLRLSLLNRNMLRAFSRSELYACRLSRVRYKSVAVDFKEFDTDDRSWSDGDSKRDYTIASSMRFGGQSRDPVAQTLPQSHAPVFSSTDTLFGLFAREDDGQPTRFTLDAWFSLAQSEPDTLAGGILLGIQSEKCRHEGGQWPTFHNQILHVDAQRDLYCSVTAEKPRIAARLELARWYHVSLVFEGQTQHVYLDGELVISQTDQELQLETFPLYYAQVGTGCISGESPGKPAPQYCGWYGFHGVIDDLRVWHEALSAGQIAAVSRDCISALRRPMYSLKRDVPVWMAHNVQQVLCSRPRERRCEVVAMCSRAGDLESWV
ncbi:hypothetical protein BBJ28_00020711 [Nothophytophthora sp. Chile5]|nr:hypothetical protein BBJ28_00020711 [Nothophytophthora sp. Chile5]